MIKQYFESRYDSNGFIQKSEYMIDSDMFMYEKSSHIHKKGFRLNKKRKFTNPSCTVQDEKNQSINYDES